MRQRICPCGSRAQATDQMRASREQVCSDKSRPPGARCITRAPPRRLRAAACNSKHNIQQVATGCRRSMNRNKKIGARILQSTIRHTLGLLQHESATNVLHGSEAQHLDNARLVPQPRKRCHLMVERLPLLVVCEGANLHSNVAKQAARLPPPGVDLHACGPSLASLPHIREKNRLQHCDAQSCSCHHMLCGHNERTWPIKPAHN